MIIRTLNPDFQIRHQGTDPVLKNNESFNTITKGLVFFLNISYIYSGLKYKLNTNLNDVRRVIYVYAIFMSAQQYTYMTNPFQTTFLGSESRKTELPADNSN